MARGGACCLLCRWPLDRRHQAHTLTPAPPPVPAELGEVLPSLGLSFPPIKWGQATTHTQGCVGQAGGGRGQGTGLSPGPGLRSWARPGPLHTLRCSSSCSLRAGDTVLSQCVVCFLLPPPAPGTSSPFRSGLWAQSGLPSCSRSHPWAHSSSLLLLPGPHHCLCLGISLFHFHSCDDSTSLLVCFSLSAGLCPLPFPPRLFVLPHSPLLPFPSRLPVLPLSPVVLPLNHCWELPQKLEASWSGGTQPPHLSRACPWPQSGAGPQTSSQTSDALVPPWLRSGGVPGALGHP